jgi:hypothetical protein
MQLIYFNMHVLLPGFLFHFFLHFLSGRRVILLLNLDEILNTNNCLPPTISSKSKNIFFYYDQSSLFLKNLVNIYIKKEDFVIITQIFLLFF